MIFLTVTLLLFVSAESKENKTSVICPCGKTGQKVVTYRGPNDNNLFDICRKFEFCGSCSDNLNQCITCPTGYYGTTCTEFSAPKADQSSEVSKELKYQRSRTRECMNIQKTELNDVICWTHDTYKECSGQCALGYHFEGSRAHEMILYCNEGEWKPVRNFPLCVPAEDKIVYCNDPEILVNGHRHNEKDEYEEGDTIIYMCNSGYTILGRDTITCLKTGHWSGGAPVCERRRNRPTQSKIACDLEMKAPGSYNCTTKTRGTYCDVYCDGHQAGRVSCFPGRRQKPYLPACIQRKGSKNKAVRCPEPETLVNGHRHNEKDVYVEGAVLIYMCDPGFTMTRGKDSVTCLKTGQWSSGAPVCERLRPRNPQVSPGRPNQSFVIYRDDKNRRSKRLAPEMPVGSSVVYSDEENIRTKRHHECQDISKTELIEVICWTGATDKECSGKCSTGHVFQGSRAPEMILRCHEGQWTPVKKFPTCIRNDNKAIFCDKPDPLINGHLHNEKDEYNEGATVMYMCDHGYKMQGVEDTITSTCLKTGRWSHRAPICRAKREGGHSNEVHCSDPERLVNGHLHDEKDTYKEGSTVMYMCDPGYTMRGAENTITSTCLKTGRWSARAPICDGEPEESNEEDEEEGEEEEEEEEEEEAFCRDPGRTTNGYREDSSDQSEHPEGTTIIYKCYRGYSLKGNARLTCLNTGSWSFERPTCVRNRRTTSTQVRRPCKDPGEIEHGTKVASSKRFSIGTVVTYSCSNNYQLDGETDLVCIGSRWSAEKPVCRTPRPNKVECPPLSVPENALVKHYDASGSESMWTVDGSESRRTMGTAGFPMGSKIRYRCRSPFYHLYGSEYQTCKSSGSWSGNQPTCIPDCGKSDSSRTPQIVNGTPTLVGQYPWQAAIYVSNTRSGEGGFNCGGSLINERWIITAAHCVTRRESNALMDRRTLFVYLGKHYREFRDDEYVQRRRARKIIVHERYDFVTFDSDIALIEMDRPIELTERVKPICLPTGRSTTENIKDDKFGVVIGWGLTEKTLLSDVLLETSLPVVSHSRCEDAYRKKRRTITVTDNMFCAGFEDGRSDSCVGDSGGPFMFLDESQRPNRWVIEGIVSWGTVEGCGLAKSYSGFTKVHRFLDWLNLYI